MFRVIFATRNANKVAEAQAAVGGQVVILPLPEELGGLEVEEGERSFIENAIAKVHAYSRHLSGWVVAEDSGIVVDRLGGFPGPISNRIAETPEERNRRLLSITAQVGLSTPEERSCRYVAALALAFGGRLSLVVVAHTRGYLLDAPTGSGGFGYDPIFYSLELEKPMGMASREEKNSVSHRGKALRMMAAYLTSRVGAQVGGG